MSVKSPMVLEIWANLCSCEIRRARFYPASHTLLGYVLAYLCGILVLYVDGNNIISYKRILLT